jgi:alpha-amylase/alpha-mannosidase (GH57 family)
MGGLRAIAIHGHFYQPPRENPWLEAVETQDSAYPFHDWNARVMAECYAPNTAARRTDTEGRIIDIVNNFERISFDVGPTLLHWLAGARPDVYAAILEADRRSVVARGGHGNAIAQVYGHAIMPLCSRRDQVTQVRWGLADFRRRFGREPEGMWLSETAADRETLEVLAAHGLAFTVLAPRQAARVRADGEEVWRDARGGIDPSRPYRWVSGDGSELALFFYDGPISQAIAFEGLLGSGDAFAARLVSAFDDRRPGAQLVHVATDGESYGHHHRFGDMALAAACHRLETTPGVTLTNHGAFLAARPPTEAVEIVEGSSWSCAHGVERWRADCGCSGGRPGWHQRWREPLREALDWARDRLDPFFEARAGVLLRDPWAARDDYVHVILDRSPESVGAFLRLHQRRSLGDADRVEALKLLELQRYRLLAYASCGWFFDDISGTETVQVLRCAARALQLGRELDAGAELEEEFVRRLAKAPSNLPDVGSGDVVYRRYVLPDLTDLRRVVAHYAIAAPYTANGDETTVYSYAVTRREWQRESYGDTSLSMGRVHVVSTVIAEAAEAAVAVLHFGGHDFHCAIREAADVPGFGLLREELFRSFAKHSLAAVVRALDQHFDGRAYGIRDLFLDERRRILALVTEGALRRSEETYRRLYEANRRLMQYLRESDAPVPEGLALVARYVLKLDLRRELEALVDTVGIPDRIGELADEARALGLDLGLDREGVAARLEQALLARMARLATRPRHEAVAAVLDVLDLGRRLACPPSLWEAQNRCFDLWRRSGPDVRMMLEPLVRALGFRLE